MSAIAAVIPTRNRPELAIQAARSLIDQDARIDIYISDNSSSPEPLRDFCAGEPRVTWLRPAAELSMPEHWDWAIRQVLERSSATHLTVHYDRKLSKPDHWGRLETLAVQRPDRLIAFPVDHVSREPAPLRIWQTGWTGKLFEIETARVAALVAAGRIEQMAHAIPILSNCVVPRPVLDAIARRFGNICNSTGPDSCFTSRFLALFDRYLFHDRATGIVHSAHRSNGMGYMTGKGGDFADFVKTFGDRPWLDAAPLPGINLGQNMFYHEYELVRRETGERLPPLDRGKVVGELAQSLRWIADPRAKAELLERLRSEGYDGPGPSPFPRRGWRAALLQARWRRLMAKGRVPPHICGFAYRSDREALAAGLRYPRQAGGDDHLALLQPAEVEP